MKLVLMICVLVCLATAEYDSSSSLTEETGEETIDAGSNPKYSISVIIYDGNETLVDSANITSEEHDQSSDDESKKKKHKHHDDDIPAGSIATITILCSGILVLILATTVFFLYKTGKLTKAKNFLNLHWQQFKARKLSGYRKTELDDNETSLHSFDEESTGTTSHPDD